MEDLKQPKEKERKTESRDSGKEERILLRTWAKLRWRRASKNGNKAWLATRFKLLLILTRWYRQS